MAKARNLKGELVTVEVIERQERKSPYTVKYRVTDGKGRSKIISGDRAEEIDRKTR